MPATDVATQIGIDIVKVLERDGYLKKGAWNDCVLLPKITEIVDERFVAVREQAARFCLWWAERGHTAHSAAPGHDHTLTDFWHCSNTLCLSLAGTLVDLAQDLKPTTPAPAEIISHAPPAQA